MTTTRRAVLGTLAAVPVASASVVSGAGTARAAVPGRVPADLRPGGKFDRYLADLAAKDEFSGTVLLAHKGRPVLARAHGMADKKASIPNRLDTIFPLASLGKIFTGVAITQLARQGKVAFRAPLGTYLDGFSAAMSEVTVHQLLTHTGGFGDYQKAEDWLELSNSWTTPEESFDGTMEIIRRQQEPLFTPGSDSSYSNAGFYTLGAIVGTVATDTGTTYWDYVRENIFEPAGMARSDFYTRQQHKTDPDFAHSYGARQADGSRPDLTEQRGGIGLGGGAGGGFAAAGDLLGFALALRDGRLLEPAFRELAFSPKSPGEGENGFVAYGASAGIVNDRRRFGHGGGALGISTSLSIFPDLDWVVVILGNYSLAMTDLTTMVNDIITAR